MSQTVDKPIELRGEPYLLFQELMASKPPRKVLEVSIEGPAGTGKSFAIGVILYALMNQFPGIRILIVRKTRTSLTEAFLKTWEENVLPEGEPMLAGPARKQRLSYEHENGSRMVVGGLDNASRLYSTDYDVVYVQEAFEISEDEWQQFRRALRNWGNKKLNFQLLLADTNPDAPGHWLNQRCLNGVTRRIRTKHENNPVLYDAKARAWTPEGSAYIESLDQLTGVRKRRLRFGEWCAAEGLVWENFDRNIHVVPAPSDYRQFKWFIAGMDWGYTDPGTIEVFGVDHERRIFLLEEYYYVQRPIEWWADRITSVARDLRDRDKRDETDPNNQGLVVVVCDPSRPDAIQLCNDYLSREGFPRIARPADNTRTTTGRGDLAGGFDEVLRDFVPIHFGQGRADEVGVDAGRSARFRAFLVIVFHGVRERVDTVHLVLGVIVLREKVARQLVVEQLRFLVVRHPEIDHPSFVVSPSVVFVSLHCDSPAP